ncbi:hypothetical protein JYU34_017757 [Plutella xylostella]|uniref:CAP-Gly domain-containing protein n=1 Tax=Plutella xylostella TaxID=51655 RepID=A0ABQ7Q207_PLUXY|nr:hypothetical protein JYU34_017757 [Plutella xylostella]
MADIQVITQDFVNVHITKSDSEDAPPIERRFKKEITVSDFKEKLELVTGGSAASMQLKLYDKKNNYKCDIDNNSALLGSYPIDDGMMIHVVDKFAMTKEFGTTESVEKFELSESEYEKKSDTVRAFLLKNKLGKYNEEEMKRIREQQEKELEEEAKLAASVLLGARCEVRVPGQPPRRAAVRYNGPLEGSKGLFIGVQYDEPLGKNDGEVKGKRYFTCPPKYGGFVRPACVTVGDFPEEPTGLEDDEI